MSDVTPRAPGRLVRGLIRARHTVGLALVVCLACVCSLALPFTIRSRFAVDQLSIVYRANELTAFRFGALSFQDTVVLHVLRIEYNDEKLAAQLWREWRIDRARMFVQTESRAPTVGRTVPWYGWFTANYIGSRSS